MSICNGSASKNGSSWHIDGLECGGAYMKLLQDNKALHADEFSNASPYVIMFGPDKCGATNKVSSTGSVCDELLIEKSRSTLSLSTRTQRPANTKRNTSRAPHQLRSPRVLPISTLLSSTKTMSSKSRSTASRAKRAIFSRTSRHP